MIQKLLESFESYPALERTKKSSKLEIFNLQHESQNWFTVEHDGWKLPATEEPHDWCGLWSYRGCLNVSGHKGTNAEGKGFLQTYQRSCFRASCSLCWKKWLGREASKSTHRIEHFEKISKKKVKHIVISCPKWTYGQTKKELAKSARTILNEVGCLGGSMIYHPNRYDKERKLWYYSPHFHILGFGWIEAVTEAYSKHGWFIKNLGERDSTFSTIYYILSHAGVKKRNHSLTWFGDLSYSKLKSSEIPALADSKQKCPYCDNDLQELFLIGNYSARPPELEMELLIDADDFAIVKYSNEEYQEPSFKYADTQALDSILESIA